MRWLALLLALVLCCAASSVRAEEMGADLDATAASAAALSTRQLLQPVLLRHAESSDASEQPLYETIEPEYSDSGEAEETTMVEEASTQHTPRIMRSSQFKEYMRSVVANARPDHSLVETATEAHAQARLSRCKLVLNSWLHKCVF